MIRAGRAATLALAVVAAIAALAAARPAQAQPADQVPAALEGVDILDRRGDRLPLDLAFTDDEGRAVTLAEFFDGSRPVILQLGYFKCPMLCNLVLNEMVAGLEDVDFTAGKEFRIVAVSVNPDETAELASVKKKGYVLEYARPGSSGGWHFLVGPETSSKALADSVGFGYRYVPETGEYAHAAALFVCTPDGRISRVLYGVKYEPGTLWLSLLEASEGRIGSALDRIILWCHVFDPEAGSYVLFAFRVMQLGGLVTVVALGTVLSVLWFRDLRHRRRSARPVSAA